MPGIYLYDHHVLEVVRALRRSPRGELEITDVNQAYLQRSQLNVYRLGRGYAWLDAGTSRSLHDASAYVQTIERRQGIKIGCPEEAALRRGFCSMSQFSEVIERMPVCEYRSYLESVLETARETTA